MTVTFNLLKRQTYTGAQGYEEVNQDNPHAMGMLNILMLDDKALHTLRRLH